ncbi:hypothetical protein F2Q69_00059063 [Brassica cretica]|uniref:Uncharacterized protein n=1 Tax=Brassica cretica TaxID=69181 RepID=A0A8S9RKF9_BRACR|nr:hypothetical protein F2Q69_00059063 [Brassica cretica]
MLRFPKLILRQAGPSHHRDQKLFFNLGAKYPATKMWDVLRPRDEVTNADRLPTRSRLVTWGLQALFKCRSFYPKEVGGPLYNIQSVGTKGIIHSKGLLPHVTFHNLIDKEARNSITARKQF